MYKYIDICSIPNVFTFTVDIRVQAVMWWQRSLAAMLLPLSWGRDWATATTGDLARPACCIDLAWHGLVVRPGPRLYSRVPLVGFGGGLAEAGSPTAVCVGGGRWLGVSVAVPTSSTWWHWAHRHLAATWHGPGLHLLLPRSPPHCYTFMLPICYGLLNRYDIWFPWQKWISFVFGLYVCMYEKSKMFLHSRRIESCANCVLHLDAMIDDLKEIIYKLKILY